MSGDAEESRYSAMLEFLCSFPAVSGPHPTDLADLGDGVALFEALSEIAPTLFDPTSIARDLGDNWALKSSNLRKLIRNLETFYHEELHKDTDFEAVVGSVGAMARHADRHSIASLFELIAAAAVTCENKGLYVGRIMGMSAANQREMKAILESSLSRLDDYEDDIDSDDGEHADGEPELVFDSDDDDDGLREEENLAAQSMDGGLFLDDSALVNAHFDLDGTTVSTAEYSTNASSSSIAAATASAYNAAALTKERDELRRALQDSRREFAAFKSQASMQAEDHENAQRKLRALAEDLQDRLARRQDDLTKVENELTKTKRTLEDNQARIIDLQEKNAAIADDLDVANAKANQLRKAEATLVAYRKKLEGVGVMSQQMVDLEDQAASYLRQIMELEADVKKMPGMQSQIDDLQTNLSKFDAEKLELQDALRARNADISKLRTDVSAAEGAKKMYEEELNELRASQQTAGGPDDDVPAFSLASAQSMTEAREKALRLGIENKNLQEQIEQLKASRDAAVTAASAAASAAAVVKSASEAGGAEEEVQQLRSEVARLKDENAKKDADKAKLANDKEKLEAYTKKTLSKFQEKYLVALQECKAKLKEKHDKIEALEMRSASEKTAQKREERLLSSTIYELGLAIMQQRLKDR